MHLADPARKSACRLKRKGEMSSKLTIGAKLIGGYAALLVLLLVISLLTMNATGSLGHGLDHALTVSAKRSAAIGQLRTALADERGLMKGMVLFFSINDPVQYENHKQKFAVAAQAGDAALRDLQSLIEDDRSKKLVDNLRASDTAMEQYFNETQRLCAEQKATEALDMISKKVMPESDTIEHAASELIEVQMALNKQEAQSGQDLASLSKWLTWVMLALSMGVGGLVFTVVMSSTRGLRTLAHKLAEGARQLTGVASQVAAASHSLARGASQQAASLEETSASSQEISSMTRRNTENARAAADLVGDADHKIEKANSSLNQMVVSMEDITGSSNKISKILKVIDEIAFQTNILALNAAVEAARAGQAGLGFAVVAEEVRSLAQKCAQAAKDTAVLIEESIAKSNEGSSTLGHVSAAIRAVTENQTKVKGLVEEVNRSSQEQARGIDQISQAFVQIEKITQGSAAGAQESASASEELNSQANSLNDIVGELRQMVGGTVESVSMQKNPRNGNPFGGSSRGSGPSKSARSFGEEMDWGKSSTTGVADGSISFPSDTDFKEI
jgi:methyl-accepting chemotaxis protein/methyl-accepting chemotaxis protein-1 (serine sensor receptor)